MREPSPQTRILASAPIFFGAWGTALWLGWQWTHHEDAWPPLVGIAILIAAVMKADEQVRAYRAWTRAWDSIGDAPPPRSGGWPQAVGIVLALPLVSLLVYTGQHSGTQAVVGVLMILLAPLLLLGLIAKLWRSARRRRAAKAGRIVPVAIRIRRPLMPVPGLQQAYASLPAHCLHLLGGRP